MLQSEIRFFRVCEVEASEARDLRDSGQALVGGTGFIGNHLDQIGISPEYLKGVVITVLLPLQWMRPASARSQVPEPVP